MVDVNTVSSAEHLVKLSFQETATTESKFGHSNRDITFNTQLETYGMVGKVRPSVNHP
jgi:hypothetical protein